MSYDDADADMREIVPFEEGTRLVRTPEDEHQTPTHVRSAFTSDLSAVQILHTPSGAWSRATPFIPHMALGASLRPTPPMVSRTPTAWRPERNASTSALR
jgi:hypothetical protein